MVERCVTMPLDLGARVETHHATKRVEPVTMKRASLTGLVVLSAACSSDPAPRTPSPAAPPPIASEALAPTPSASPSASPSATASTSTATQTPVLTTKSFAFPGATAPASLDLIAIEREKGRVWVPVGNTGSVDVFDIAKGSFTRVDGFKTVERERKGQKRTIGPSAASIGEGVVYIGNRASSEVCAVDAMTLKLGACLKVPGSVDIVAYVASAKEVWVTTPHEKALVVLDASKPAQLKAKTIVKVEGEPEGAAVDDAHGVFYTNLEDKDRTLAIDIKTHAVKSTWKPSCGEDGPKGMAVDGAHALLFIACPEHVQVLDTSHDGAPLAKLDTGDGVDDISWLDAKRLLFVGAAKAAKLTVLHADEKGQLRVFATATTAEGARNAVADAAGNAYLTDAKGAGLIVATMP